MARQVAGTGKHHRPRHRCRGAPQLSIDKIPDTAKTEPDRDNRSDKITNTEKPFVRAARKQGNRNQHTDQTSVERHTTLPYLEDIERMRQVIRKIVKQHRAETTTDDQPDRTVKDQI